MIHHLFFIRTLEFLMCHLVRVASYSAETNMHARNLAIVWAPNLLRFVRISFLHQHVLPMSAEVPLSNYNLP